MYGPAAFLLIINDIVTRLRTKAKPLRAIGSSDINPTLMH